nr:MAG TPA: hypothetical protein [Caudoviricetes sp.]
MISRLFVADPKGFEPLTFWSVGKKNDSKNAIKHGKIRLLRCFCNERR